MQKHLLIVALALLSQHGLRAQCVLNGGFELWDSTYVPPEPYPVPVDWIWALPNICNSGNYLAVPDTISNSGAYSAKLESQICTNGQGGDVLEEGRLFSGGAYSPPRGWSFACDSFPTSLDFHYVFHHEGNDSAYVKILLFNYDSITPGLSSKERVDTVAYSTGYIHQETTSFTPFSLPINYLTADTPAFLHIYFCTSKTLAENHGNTIPYMYAYPGTTLWLDDVHISTSGLGVPDNIIYKEPLFFPNHANDVLYFREPQRSTIQSVRVTDLRGRNTLYQASPTAQPLYIGDLPTGMYFVRCTLSNGLEIMNKLLVQ